MQRGSVAAGMSRVIEVEFVARMPGRVTATFDIATGGGGFVALGVTGEVVAPGPTAGGPAPLARGVRAVGEVPVAVSAAAALGVRAVVVL